MLHFIVWQHKSSVHWLCKFQKLIHVSQNKNSLKHFVRRQLQISITLSILQKAFAIEAYTGFWNVPRLLLTGGEYQRYEFNFFAKNAPEPRLHGFRYFLNRIPFWRVFDLHRSCKSKTSANKHLVMSEWWNVREWAQACVKVNGGHLSEFSHANEWQTYEWAEVT